jgi:hypothetical protein
VKTCCAPYCVSQPPFKLGGTPYGYAAVVPQTSAALRIGALRAAEARVLWATCTMTCNSQHGRCNMHRNGVHDATYDMQHVRRNMQHKTCNLTLDHGPCIAACNISIYSVQRTTCADGATASVRASCIRMHRDVPFVWRGTHSVLARRHIARRNARASKRCMLDAARRVSACQQRRLAHSLVHPEADAGGGLACSVACITQYSALPQRKRTRCECGSVGRWRARAPPIHWCV